MSKRKSQQGNVILIVIIIIAVVILCVAGYMIWQNFIKEKSNETGNTNISTSTVLAIPEWKIKGVYDSDTVLKYEVKSGETNFGRYGIKTGDHLLFYSDDIGIYGDANSTGTDDCDNSIGDIVRSSEPVETTDEYSWNIGDYYYTYVAPQSYCTDKSGEILPEITEVLNSMKEFFARAKSIK